METCLRIINIAIAAIKHTKFILLTLIHASFLYFLAKTLGKFVSLQAFLLIDFNLSFLNHLIESQRFIVFFQKPFGSFFSPFALILWIYYLYSCFSFRLFWFKFNFFFRSFFGLTSLLSQLLL